MKIGGCPALRFWRRVSQRRHCAFAGQQVTGSTATGIDQALRSGASGTWRSVAHTLDVALVAFKVPRYANPSLCSSVNTGGAGGIIFGTGASKAAVESAPSGRGPHRHRVAWNQLRRARRGFSGPLPGEPGAIHVFLQRCGIRSCCRVSRAWRYSFPYAARRTSSQTWGNSTAGVTGRLLHDDHRGDANQN